MTGWGLRVFTVKVMLRTTLATRASNNMDISFIIRMAIVTTGGIGFWIWSWYMPLYEGTYSLKLAALGPMFTVVGIGFILFPADPESSYYKAWKQAKEAGESVPFHELPMKYVLLTVFAVAAGFCHMFIIGFQFGGWRLPF